MKMRKELRRGLVALVVLACLGAAAYATVGSSSAFGMSARNAVAGRLRRAR